jgi:hypothetical protein
VTGAVGQATGALHPAQDATALPAGPSAGAGEHDAHNENEPVGVSAGRKKERG